MAVSKYQKDGTYTWTVNGSARMFHKTLAIALRYASKHGQAELTNTQAIEFVRTHKLTDNEGQPFELYREIHDCGCNHKRSSDMCFSTALNDEEEDLTDRETAAEFVDGWEVYQVWANRLNPCEDVQDMDTCIDRASNTKCNACLRRMTELASN